MYSVDGYGAGTGLRLLPVTGTRPGQKQTELSPRQASDTLAEAYGLTTPAQKEAFAKLGLFQESVQLHPVAQNAYIALTIPPELHNQLRSVASNIKAGQAQQQQAAAARAQHATQVATQTRQALETGRIYADPKQLSSDLQRAGVGKPEVDRLVRLNNQKVTEYLTNLRGAHATGRFVDGLQKLMPGLVKSGYVTQKQAQQLLDKNWLNWARSAVLSGDAKAPSRKEVNKKGYEIIARYSGKTKEAFKQQVEDIKARLQQRSARPAPISAPVPAAPPSPAPTVAQAPRNNDNPGTPVRRGPNLTGGLPFSSEARLPTGPGTPAGQNNGQPFTTVYDDPNQLRFVQGEPDTFFRQLQRQVGDFVTGLTHGRPGAGGGMYVRPETATDMQILEAQTMSSAQNGGVTLRETLNLAPIPLVTTVLEGVSAMDLGRNRHKEQSYGRTAEQAGFSAGLNGLMDAVTFAVPFIIAKRAPKPDVPTVRTTTPEPPALPPRPTGPLHSLSKLPGMSDITQFALGRLRGANGRAIPPAALPDTPLYRGTTGSFVQNNTIGVNPKGTGAYVMPDGSIKLASEVHSSFEGGVGASYFSTNPNYARNYAQQNGGVVVEVRVRDLQQLVNEGKVILAPDSAGTQHIVVLGPLDTRIPVTMTQP